MQPGARRLRGALLTYSIPAQRGPAIADECSGGPVIALFIRLERSLAQSRPATIPQDPSAVAV
jgi:hypothetical protein